MPSKIEEKRAMYTGSTLDPNGFQSASDFRTAIQTIDTSLYLILSPKKLAKRAAIEDIQLSCVEVLESLKQQIIAHPNYTIFQEKEIQESLTEKIEQQGCIIETDKQLMTWLLSIIPQNNHRLHNAENFKKNFLERVLKTGIFDEQIWYGQYETYITNKTILGVLDMTNKRDAFIIILNIPYGYIGTNLYLYKLPVIHTKNKPMIKPSVILADNYINPKKIIVTESTPSS